MDAKKFFFVVAILMRNNISGIHFLSELPCMLYFCFGLEPRKSECS